MVIPLALAACLHFWLTSQQTRIEVNGGLGYDGYHYMKMAESMVKGDQVTAPAPFAYRVLTPFLAAFNSEAPYQGFVLIGIVANFCSIALLHLWLLKHLKSASLAGFLTLAFMLMVHGPFRFHYYYPNLTDPLAWLCFILGVIVLDLSHHAWRNLALVSVLSVVGVLVRESLLVFSFAYVFVAWKGARRVELKGLLMASIPLAFGVLTLLLVRAVVAGGGGYSSYDEAIRFLYSKSLPRYAHAWLLVFGPLLAVPLAYPRLALAHLQANPSHAAYLAAVAVLAFVGGNDTERFIIWSVPPSLLMLGVLLQRWKAGRMDRCFLALGLSLAFLVSQRFLSPIPPVSPTVSTGLGVWLVPQGQSWSYLELKSWDCAQATSTASLAQLLVLCLLLSACLRTAALHHRLRAASA